VPHVDDGGARRGTRLVGWILVVAQLGLVALCLVPVGPVGGPTLPGLGLACLALAAVVGVLALRALGQDTRVHPEPASTALRTEGIYRRVRHPMYTAVLLACLGVAVASGRLLSIACFAALAVVLVAKSRFEDQLLHERFGAAHDAYVAEVPALVPLPVLRRG